MQNYFFFLTPVQVLVDKQNLLLKLPLKHLRNIAQWHKKSLRHGKPLVLTQKLKRSMASQAIIKFFSENLLFPKTLINTRYGIQMNPIILHIIKIYVSINCSKMAEKLSMKSKEKKYMQIFKNSYSKMHLPRFFISPTNMM